MKKTLLAICTAAGSLTAALALAADPAPKHEHHHEDETPATEAVCVIMPTEGHKAAGVLVLTQTDKGVKIVGELTGLKPGEHGFHIHQAGDLRSADGSSAGGHYNPHNKPHGGPETHEHHEGDLGNIKANGEGVAKVDTLADDVHLHFIIGRSLVVHADADDLKSQPAGNSGKRIGVGVIGVANMPAPTAKK